MAPRIVLVCVALCVAQAAAQSIGGTILQSLYNQYSGQLQALSEQLKGQMQMDINSLNNFLQSEVEWIKSEVADAQAKGVAAQDCLDDHQDDLEALQTQFAADSQKCFDDNLGSTTAAAQKLQDDLASIGNQTKALFAESAACGFSISCQKSVVQKFTQLSQQGPTLAADYSVLQQQAAAAKVVIDNCKAQVVDAEISASQAIYDSVQQCVQAKEEAAAASSQ